ncbi:MAG TPA: hypothetical protein VKV39_02040 [Candidatus Sulfotelmatobacter sp.]|nr:hypothetical protein [Candidatus Sulfotelmatobacter sp.]
MRIFVLVTLLTASAFAQTAPVALTGACGPKNVSFKVSLNESQHDVATPEPGKALVYFIHDAGTNWNVRYPTLKVALDGAWVGASHGNSYFPVSVEPGEHHLCVMLQSSAASGLELAHFTAAADTVYYYRTRLFYSTGLSMLELAPVDTDQAKYLIASFPMAVASPKK